MSTQILIRNSPSVWATYTKLLAQILICLDPSTFAVDPTLIKVYVNPDTKNVCLPFLTCTIAN